MSNRMLTLFSLLIILCITALLTVQFLPTFWNVATETYVTYNGTKGIAVEHNRKPWTLNFDQQNAFINSINRGENIGQELIKKNPSLFPYSKITVYQFDKPDLTFTPVSIQDQNIVFEAPQVIENGYIKEGSNGKLKEILSRTFDR